jgi:hypothetical protein
MAENKEEKKTNWVEWIKERIGAGGQAPQKVNLKFGRIAWCQAFDRGDQYKILNELTGMIEDVHITRETRCIYNICKTFNDAYASKMWKGSPTPTTSPFSTNTESYDEDINVATNAAVEYWWKSVAYGSMKLYDTTRTAAVGGIGIAKVYYDKNQQSGLYTGEVILEKVNPLHLYPNADATCDEEFREVNHRFPKEKSVAEEEFSEQMKKLGITELESQSKNDAHPEIAEASKKVDDGPNAEVKNSVIVNDIWIKKCKKYPNGKHVIVIGEHTLVEEDNPEPDMLPFFAYVVNPQDNDLYGLGITYPIIPIQRDMNKNSSIIAENADSMGHLKWLVKEGSVTNPSAFDDQSGEIVEYIGDAKPHQSTANPLPEYINGRWWQLLDIAKFVTHIQDLGLGMIPPKGSQMSTGTTNELVNGENVMFAPDIERMVKFVQKIVRRYLFLVKKYYQEDRIVTIIGENKRPEAIIFKRENLADNYNVDIKVGSGFDRSDDAQVTAITNLMQTPAFEQAGIDPRVVMEELMRKMNITKLREDTFKDERQAKRYLDYILANPGKEYAVNRYVNPNAHIKVFTDFTKQPEFDLLHPVVRGTIEGYIDRMVNMLPPPPSAPMGPPPGAPGNEFPAPPSNEPIDTGGRPPEQNMDLAASQPAPQGV